MLGENEVRDRQGVYWAGTYRRGQEYFLVRHNRVESITGADPARYRVLKWGHGKDGSHAYHEGRRLKGVRDPASFEVLTPRLSRDARRAYFEDVEIPDSDGASFEIIDIYEPEWVRDRQRAWHVRFGQPEPGQPHQRQVQQFNSSSRCSLQPDARDARGLFERGRRLPTRQP